MEGLKMIPKITRLFEEPDALRGQAPEGAGYLPDSQIPALQTC